ncbi:hypothetical protein K1719_020738 [Acacia pycnantha]|nr:hypothetical protein K1719_020738 [Acacia pycnantha]
MKIKKKAAGLLKLQGLREGRKGILSIDAEMFEVGPYFHPGEVTNLDGDTLEFQKILKQGIRTALQDIFWVWQSDDQEQQSEQQLQIHDPQPHESQHQYIHIVQLFVRDPIL